MLAGLQGTGNYLKLKTFIFNIELISTDIDYQKKIEGFLLHLFVLSKEQNHISFFPFNGISQHCFGWDQDKAKEDMP